MSAQGSWAGWARAGLRALERGPGGLHAPCLSLQGLKTPDPGESHSPAYGPGQREASRKASERCDLVTCAPWRASVSPLWEELAPHSQAQPKGVVRGGGPAPAPQNGTVLPSSGVVEAPSSPDPVPHAVPALLVLLVDISISHSPALVSRTIPQVSSLHLYKDPRREGSTGPCETGARSFPFEDPCSEPWAGRHLLQSLCSHSTATAAGQQPRQRGTQE